MCGIAGYFGNEERNSSQLTNTLNILKNRGPNHSGHKNYKLKNKSLDLLHTRLSILDLDSRSNQPFFDHEHCLIYNGELYNYIEVRVKLEKVGFTFHTSGDTEVLFKALKYWGKNAMQHLNGMWAFAFYHIKNETLWLCRDRFGEKPLYVRHDNQQITFSSEIKAIENLRSEKETINQEQLLRYMVLGYKSLYKGDHTFFKNIKEVPKAHLIEISSDGQVSQECYWKPSLQMKNMTYEEAVFGFKEKLIHSVKTRMRTDVPLAFCLSGGVDSTSLASIASKELGMNIQTYSIIDGDPRYNESDNIEATVNDLNCKNTMVHLNLKDNHLESLTSLIQYHDSPVTTITYYIHSLLMKEVAKDGVKVSVSGAAADELVTGYYDHFLCYLYEMRHHPSYNQHLLNWKKYILPIIRNPLLQNPNLYQENIHFREQHYFKKEIFSSYLTVDFDQTFQESNYHTSLLRNRMLNELFHEVTPITMHEEDLNNMYYSIENRSPYLDHDLMEFAYSIPTEHLMKDGRAKVILRDSMKGILNDQVRLDRRKRGFNASLESLIDFKQKSTKEFLLDNSCIYDFVDKSKIEKALTYENLENSFSKFLYSFINSKIFLDQRSSL